MASIYKRFKGADATTTKTILHEAIPITGTIASGTYNAGGRDSGLALGSEYNIKNYSHGMFQSVFDYPYLSSSANHIFDITTGYSKDSILSSSAYTQNSKKINIYNQMAKILVGHSASGEILKFDADADRTTGGDSIDQGFFLNFSRLLIKDEIKKGSFSIDLGVATASFEDPMAERIRISDVSASSDYRTDSPAGEYGFLYVTSSGSPASGGPQGVPPLMNVSMSVEKKVGLIFYHAGVVFISSSVFMEAASGGILSQSVSMSRDWTFNGTRNPSTSNQFTNFVTGTSISGTCDAVRHRIHNIQFNNTTEINSRIYFCRLAHNQFNYSTNPTYLSSSKIVVKENSKDPPVAFLTTVGLYGPRNELLAVAKLSEPLRKDPTTELTLRVRLDY